MTRPGGGGSSRVAARAVRVATVLALVGVLATGPWVPLPVADPDAASLAPAGAHPLGTSPYGHDLLALVSAATLKSAAQALWATGLTLLAAGAVGVTAAYRPGGLFDRAQMLLARLLDSLGLFLIASCLVTVAPRLTPWSLGLVLAALVWPALSGVVRAEAVALLGTTYVESARAVGVPPLRIATRYLLPAMADRIVPPALALVGAFVGLFGALGFLGVGVSSELSLGFLVYDSTTFVRSSPWYFAAGFGGFAALLSCVFGLSAGWRRAPGHS